MVQLGNDLATAWAGLKATLWALESQVYAATAIDAVNAIEWTQVA